MVLSKCRSTIRWSWYRFSCGC